ncbi:MAG: ATP-binding protein, partial [Pirellulaceae bacterium]
RTRAERHKLSVTLNSLSDGVIVVDEKHGIDSINCAAAVLTGWAVGEGRGRQFDEVFVFHDEAHGQRIEGVIDRALRASANGSSERGVLHAANGRATCIEVNASRFDNEELQQAQVAVVFRDISSRREEERAIEFLAESSVGLAELVDPADAMRRVTRMTVPSFADFCVVQLIDSEQQISPVAYAHRDPAQERLLGELVQHNRVHWDSPSLIAQVIRTRTAEWQEHISPELMRMRTIDPHTGHLLARLAPRSLVAVPILIRDQAAGAIAFVRCGSREPFARREFLLGQEFGRRVAVALENCRLYADLQRSSKQKDEFLAMLAHELRNPLSAIQYAHEMVAMGRDDVRQSGHAIIRRQIQNLSRLVGDLLDVSRITQDKIELQLEAVDMRDVVQRAMSAVESLMVERSHHVTLDLPTAPVPVLADSTRLEQVFANLLHNAAKYTPAQGRIEVRMRTDADCSLVEIRDNGCGIAPDKLPYIFDLFVQLERGIAREPGGLGIGLTVVRRLVELHRGRVWAESEGLGRGARFHVWLPLTHNDLAAAAIPPPPELQLTAGMKVLLVDDNQDSVDVLALLLQDSGATVRTAYDGPSALQMAGEFQPDVCLLDIGLPGLDGYEVARRLRQRGYERMRLIALSGYGRKQDRARSIAAGFDEHAVKPISHERLVELLNSTAPRAPVS